VIRPASAIDAAAIAALSIEVWVSTYIKRGMTHEFAEYVLSEFTVERIGVAIGSADEQILVSENVEGIDGYIRVSGGRDAPVTGCGSVEISTLYVQPRHQGQGVGAALARSAIDLGHDSLWLKVNSENLAAIGFYSALGFRRVGVTQFRLGDAEYENEVMALGSGG
jgi:ribosomal protein S18 acetylase RimI-like enzyme